MNNSVISCLFGHSSYCYDYTPYLKHIKECLIDLIENKNVNTFYSGGRGKFDSICARMIFDLKEIYPHIINYLILSYMPKDSEFIDLTYYDGSLYLLDRRVPPRYAILKTNEAMIDSSEYVISGVIHTWGGAYKACEYARKRKKKVLYICNSNS